jgi:hypothetical protein
MTRCAIVLFALAVELSSVRADAGLGHDRIAALYQRALAGDVPAVVQCIDALEAVLKSKPENQLARVYLGSAYTLRSRDLGFGREKLGALKQGLALMDSAATAAPDNARVRLVRAVTNESMPFFLGRRKVARDELYALTEIIQRDPTKLAANDQQLLYLNAGLAAKQDGDKETAVKFFRLGLTKPADPKLTAELNAALKKI